MELSEPFVRTECYTRLETLGGDAAPSVRSHADVQIGSVGHLSTGYTG